MGSSIARQASIGGIETHWIEAPVGHSSAPTLYVHGVPTGGWEWRDFVERTGGYAPDLPGFGQSDKPASFDYSIEGYAQWLERFVEQRGLERFSLVVHDWGAVGLALAQSMPDRIDRLVIACAVPFLPGYRWHVIARQWRRPVVGELAMGFTTKLSTRAVLNRSNRRPVPRQFVDGIWESFDHGTQRAILKLYRSAPSDVLAGAGERLGSIESPALVLYGSRDPYLPSCLAQQYADALGGETTVKVLEDCGHWPWLDDPTVVDEIAGFVAGYDHAGA